MKTLAKDIKVGQRLIKNGEEVVVSSVEVVSERTVYIRMANVSMIVQSTTEFELVCGSNGKPLPLTWNEADMHTDELVYPPNVRVGDVVMLTGIRRRVNELVTLDSGRIKVSHEAGTHVLSPTRVLQVLRPVA